MNDFNDLGESFKILNNASILYFLNFELFLIRDNRNVLIYFIEGQLQSVSPTTVTIDNQGIGYEINISLNTFSQIQDLDKCRLYTYYYINNDQIPTLYGFKGIEERHLFLQLISVNGVGPNTARTMLSGFGPEEILNAIINEDLSTLKSIKGIGVKTAKLIILQLKDKLEKSQEKGTISGTLNNSFRNEALQGLINLGFNKNNADKLIIQVLKENPGLNNTQELVKKALKIV